VQQAAGQHRPFGVGKYSVPGDPVDAVVAAAGFRSATGHGGEPSAAVQRQIAILEQCRLPVFYRRAMFAAR
jgi:hypothetical protein